MLGIAGLYSSGFFHFTSSVDTTGITQDLSPAQTSALIYNHTSSYPNSKGRTPLLSAYVDCMSSYFAFSVMFPVSQLHELGHR